MSILLFLWYLKLNSKIYLFTEIIQTRYTYIFFISTLVALFNLSIVVFITGICTRNIPLVTCFTSVNYKFYRLTFWTDYKKRVTFLKPYWDFPETTIIILLSIKTWWYLLLWIAYPIYPTFQCFACRTCRDRLTHCYFDHFTMSYSVLLHIILLLWRI